MLTSKKYPVSFYFFDSPSYFEYPAPTRSESNCCLLSIVSVPLLITPAHKNVVFFSLTPANYIQTLATPDLDFYALYVLNLLTRI